MGGTLAFVLGGAALAPAFTRRSSQWLSAGRLSTLKPGVPTAVTLRVSRQDGYAQVVDRKVVYLVRNASDDVRVLDSTCTHLGCRTRFDAEAGQIVCPCHGGVYDTDGRVVSGPPPAPLPSLTTRIEGDDILVEV